MSKTQTDGRDAWTLWDSERENARHFGERSTAEDKRDELSDMVDLELFPPGELPDALDSDETGDTEDSGPVEECAICGDEVAISEARAGPEGQPIHGKCYADREAESVVEQKSEPSVEVLDHSPDADPAPDTDHDPEALSPEEIEAHAADLDDRDVGTDPLKWMPGEFVDEIDGSQAINRKGFEVLRYFYDVQLDMEMEVDPDDNDMTHCRFKAVATRDGDTVEAWGTSHVDRGDDPWLLVEMAATRARKRAISIATGAGAVAVAELQNEVEQ